MVPMTAPVMFPAQHPQPLVSAEQGTSVSNTTTTNGKHPILSATDVIYRQVLLLSQLLPSTNQICCSFKSSYFPSAEAVALPEAVVIALKQMLRYRSNYLSSKAVASLLKQLLFFQSSCCSSEVVVVLARPEVIGFNYSGAAIPILLFYSKQLLLFSPVVSLTVV